MDTPNQPIPQLPVTNGTASITNGNIDVSARNRTQAQLSNQTQTQSDAQSQSQPQGISAGTDVSAQAFANLLIDSVRRRDCLV